MSKVLELTKVKNVKTPTRGTSKSAGIDFYIPEYTEEEAKKINENYEQNLHCKVVAKEGLIRISPGGRINLPSGIHVKIPEGYMLVFENKSGIASKKGLTVMAKIVDEDYQGEVHINVANVSNNVVYLNFGQKIVQGILIPVLYCEINEKNSLDELYPEKTERGSGGFGSTGV